MCRYMNSPKKYRIHLGYIVLFAVTTIIFVFGLLCLTPDAFLRLKVSKNCSLLVGMSLVAMSIFLYLASFVLFARKHILKHKIHALESIFACVLLFLEANILIGDTSLRTSLPSIDAALASSTLNSMMILLGPLLGVLGALVIFFYKSLEDRKMLWEKELIECMEEPYRKKTIIEELTRRVSQLTSESKEIRFNLIFVFLIFVLTLITCFANQNFISAGLLDSSIRLIIPIGFFILSILSILPLVFSFNGGLSSILAFPTSVNPMLTIDDAQNILCDDPFGSILICFFTVEKTTEQFLSSYSELPRIRSHTYLGGKLREISSKLGRQFEFLSELRDKTVFGLLEPTTEMATNYIDDARSYLKLIDDFPKMNRNRGGGYKKNE